MMMMLMMIIAMLMKDQNNSFEAPIDTCIEEFFAFTKVFQILGSHLQGSLGFHLRQVASFKYLWLKYLSHRSSHYLWLKYLSQRSLQVDHALNAVPQ